MPSDDPGEAPSPPAPDTPGDPGGNPTVPPGTPGDPAVPTLPPGVPGAPGDPNPSNVPPLAPVPDAAIRIAEGLVFASAAPVSAARLAPLLPEGVAAEAVLEALAATYAGRGVTLVRAAGGWAFRTAADLAPALTKVIETPRRLPRAAMEALAIIAWHGPVTRPEIEDIRGTALSQHTLDLLLENALVAPRGRKEAPGRPTLWATTPRFLEHFGLASLRDLPRREDLLPDPVLPFGAPANPDAAPAA